MGLEHIDSGDIHIREYGSPDEVKGGKLKCYPGDVIFGKRRAYQRKAALVDFEGICSAHAFVFRANEEVVDPKLFPFFLHSDQFMHRMVDISVGGLSPTINWGDLKGQEFLLPPKDQQAEIAELLWASDAQVDGTTSMVLSCEQLILADRENRFLGLNEEKTVQHPRLKGDVGASLTFVELGDLAIDVSYGTSAKSNTVKSGIPVLGIPQVVGGKLELADLNFVELGSKEHEKLMLRKGDILIIRTNGNPSYTGKSSIFDEGGDFVFASYLIRVRVDPEVVLPRFLIAYLQTTIVRRYFTRSATSSAGNYNINSQTIKRLPVPVLSLVDQENLVRDVESDQDCLEMLMRRLELGNELQRSLVNSVFDHV